VNINGSQEKGSDKEKSSKEDRKKEKVISLLHTLTPIFLGWRRNSPASPFLRSCTLCN
jgi:hypothetical protein